MLPTTFRLPDAPDTIRPPSNSSGPLVRAAPTAAAEVASTAPTARSVTRPTVPGRPHRLPSLGPARRTTASLLPRSNLHHPSYREPQRFKLVCVFTNDEPEDLRARQAETAAEQAARVQLLYRQVNERIQSVGAGIFGMAADEPLSVVCECLDPSCVRR